jgi:hypothetical protein
MFGRQDPSARFQSAAAISFLCVSGRQMSMSNRGHRHRHVHVHAH